MKMNTDNI